MVVHPVDKTDNYIKRCVAIAGDTIANKKWYCLYKWSRTASSASF